MFISAYVRSRRSRSRLIAEQKDVKVTKNVSRNGLADFHSHHSKQDKNSTKLFLSNLCFNSTFSSCKSKDHCDSTQDCRLRALNPRDRSEVCVKIDGQQKCAKIANWRETCEDRILE